MNVKVERTYVGLLSGGFIALLIFIIGIVYNAGAQSHQIETNKCNINRIEQRLDARLERIESSLLLILDHKKTNGL
jgi:hypothetical protein